MAVRGDGSVDEARGGVPAVIEFNGVSKRFGRRTVLNDLTFTVPQGSVVGLLGPNGAGKSTAMRVLLGLMRPDQGRASILGHQPGSRGFRDVLTTVGSIIESPPLYRNATALQNLEIRVAALGLSIKDADVREVINLVDLGERADDKVGRFSLGMRQRVGLALALVGNPRVVVLDEPTNGLDPVGAMEIRDLIRDLPQRGTTALLCTHRLEEVEKACDYVVVLRQGSMVTQGTLAEVIGSRSGHSVEVEVAPHEAGTAVQALARLGLSDVTASGGNLRVGHRVEDPSAITRALADEGIYLGGLRIHTPSLEEVFMQIMGEGVAR